MPGGARPVRGAFGNPDSNDPTETYDRDGFQRIADRLQRAPLVSLRSAGFCANLRPVRPQPLIAVADVEASSRWYQRLLGCRSAHGGRAYERLVDAGGRLVMQLHDWDVEHHHGAVGNPDQRPYGNGVLLWFEVDDFDAAVARATALKATVVLAPHRNPPDGDGGPDHREIWLRDLDGYTVVLASPDGEASRPAASSR